MGIRDACIPVRADGRLQINEVTDSNDFQVGRKK